MDGYIQRDHTTETTSLMCVYERKTDRQDVSHPHAQNDVFFFESWGNIIWISEWKSFSWYRRTVSPAKVSNSSRIFFWFSKQISLYETPRWSAKLSAFSRLTSLLEYFRFVPTRIFMISFEFVEFSSMLLNLIESTEGNIIINMKQYDMTSHYLMRWFFLWSFWIFCSYRIVLTIL